MLTRKISKRQLFALIAWSLAGVPLSQAQPITSYDLSEDFSTTKTIRVGPGVMGGRTALEQIFLNIPHIN